MMVVPYQSSMSPLMVMPSMHIVMSTTERNIRNNGILTILLRIDQLHKKIIVLERWIDDAVARVTTWCWMVFDVRWEMCVWTYSLGIWAMGTCHS